MRQSLLPRFAGLLLALTLTACAAYQAQHKAAPAPTAGPAAESAHHHAALPKSKASGEFCELHTDQQAARIRGEVEHTKAELAKLGRYACCVDPPCTECLMNYGECHCREVVRTEGPCCGECTQAWVEGKGTVEGITAWELIERKKERLKEHGGGAAAKEESEGAKAPPHHHHH